MLSTVPLGRLSMGDPGAGAGAAAHERVRDRFLGTHSLLDYLDLLERLLTGRPAHAH